MTFEASPSRPRGAQAAGATVFACVALALAGCATYYDLTLTPRAGGNPSYGTAHELTPGQAAVSITIDDKTYKGTWTQLNPERSTTYVGASSWGWWEWGPSSAGNRDAGETVARALLQAFDGTGMRCDFYGSSIGHGTGKCVDDKGLIFDVQFRSRNSQ